MANMTGVPDDDGLAVGDWPLGDGPVGEEAAPDGAPDGAPWQAGLHLALRDGAGVAPPALARGLALLDRIAGLAGPVAREVPAPVAAPSAAPIMQAAPSVAPASAGVGEAVIAGDASVAPPPMPQTAPRTVAVALGEVPVSLGAVPRLADAGAGLVASVVPASPVQIPPSAPGAQVVRQDAPTMAGRAPIATLPAAWESAVRAGRAAMGDAMPAPDGAAPRDAPDPWGGMAMAPRMPPLTSPLEPAVLAPRAAPFGALAGQAGLRPVADAPDATWRVEPGTLPSPRLAARTASARQSPFTPAGPGGEGGPSGEDDAPGVLEGRLEIDGAALGRWIVDHLAREAGRPPTGMTGVDPRLGLPWAGAMQG